MFIFGSVKPFSTFWCNEFQQDSLSEHLGAAAVAADTHYALEKAFLAPNNIV